MSFFYNIYDENTFKDYIIIDFMMNKPVDINYNIVYSSPSVSEYFNKQRYENEKSIVRSVLRMNGDLEYIYWHNNGLFIYRKY